MNIRAPKEKRSERRALPFEDVEALIAAQPLLREQVALMLLAWLGLRKGELRLLRIADFNLTAGTVTVERETSSSTQSRTARGLWIRPPCTTGSSAAMAELEASW